MKARGASGVRGSPMQPDPSWHKPKGNKSIWIAEHQRGDASLGFITHDYAITHEEPGPIKARATTNV
jgi:hypothetical protein